MCKNRKIIWMICIMCILSVAAMIVCTHEVPCPATTAYAQEDSGLTTTVCAHEVPDLTRTGSISITLTCEGEVVSGGTLTFYRVGEISEENGNYSFTLTDEFEGSGENLTDVSAAALAEDLAEYASLNDISGETVAVGDDGTAYYGDIELGLYLVEQSEAAAGYEKFLPFLVTVPTNENGQYIYNVNATPKLTEIKEKPEDPDEPDEPDGPNDPDEPEDPDKPGDSDMSSRHDSPESGDDPTLPQTGQLNWPVPVCALVGICLFFLGYALRFGQREKNDET